MIINEGGINWVWYTELEVNRARNSVRILRHFRLHKWDEDKGATKHPDDAVCSDENPWRKCYNIFSEYNVPGMGWMSIENPSSEYSALPTTTSTVVF